MTKEQFDILHDWIRAMIAKAMSHDSSDGGLIESVHLSEIENEARRLLTGEP